MFSGESNRRKTIAALKAQLAAMGPVLRSPQAPIPSQWSALDDRIQGWPHPGLTEISGRAGSGRIQLCLPSIAHISRHARVGIVDPLGQLYPPGWHGVHLERLLIVRPPLERCVWSTEQLARSGCFALVGLLDPPRLGRSAARLSRAAEQGACSLFLWTTEGDTRTPAKLRIQVLERRDKHLRVHLPREAVDLWI